ncbi:MAG: hypothetical protein Q8N53_10470 [Longimicrobiales bacterium]|nr:hypothetical protein [Longimicrobiales bacterium]
MKYVPFLLAVRVGLCAAPATLSAQSLDTVPPWGGELVTSRSLAEVLAYARGLPFDLDPWDAPEGPVLLRELSGFALGPRVQELESIGV